MTTYQPGDRVRYARVIEDAKITDIEYHPDGTISSIDIMHPGRVISQLIDMDDPYTTVTRVPTAPQAGEVREYFGPAPEAVRAFREAAQQAMGTMSGAIERFATAIQASAGARRVYPNRAQEDEQPTATEMLDRFLDGEGHQWIEIGPGAERYRCHHVDGSLSKFAVEREYGIGRDLAPIPSPFARNLPSVPAGEVTA